MLSNKVIPLIFNKGLGKFDVNGSIRLPKPAANIIAANELSIKTRKYIYHKTLLTYCFEVLPDLIVISV